MTNAENPPVPAWRIRLKTSGVLIYLVSSTEPYLRPDGSLDFTPMRGYGDEVGRIDWTDTPLITWRYLDPDMA